MDTTYSSLSAAIRAGIPLTKPTTSFYVTEKDGDLCACALGCVVVALGINEVENQIGLYGMTVNARNIRGFITRTHGRTSFTEAEAKAFAEHLGISVAPYERAIMGLVVYANDKTKATREQIADALEAIGY